jgi:hypothetical protein
MAGDLVWTGVLSLDFLPEGLDGVRFSRTAVLAVAVERLVAGLLDRTLDRSAPARVCRGVA